MTEPRIMHGDETPSPVDLPGAEDLVEQVLGWTVRAITIATLFLAATNAVTIQAWADEMTPSPIQARIANAADRWVEITDGIGLGLARARMHAAWKWAQAGRFGAGPAGDPEAAADQR